MSNNGFPKLFNILTADKDCGVLVVEIRKDFIDTVAWALKHCPDDRRHKSVAGVLASQMMKVAGFFYGDKSLEDLLDINNREIVEFVIENNVETPFRRTA